MLSIHGGTMGNSDFVDHDEELRKAFNKPQWKKAHPKEVRGILDPNMQTNDARRENREMRKRMARRMRRIEKREMREDEWET